jgi:hypothetical protein
VASRQAAALASSVFARALAAADQAAATTEVFAGAANDVQRRLEVLRTWLLSPEAGSSMASIAAPLPESTMRMFLEKTAGGCDVRRVALATTLLGGFLDRNAGGMAQFQLARYGDGVVEHYSRRTGEVELLMGMEAGQYRVERYLSPLAATSEGPPEVVERTLEPGDWLLLSSDGLGRTGGTTLWAELGDVLGAPPDRFFVGQGETAIRTAFGLLGKHVSGDDVPPDRFDDNWSLIVIQIEEGG